MSASPWSTLHQRSLSAKVLVRVAFVAFLLLSETSAAQDSDWIPNRLLARLPAGIELIPEVDSTTSGEVNDVLRRLGLVDSRFLFEPACPGHSICETIYGRWVLFDFRDSIDVQSGAAELNQLGAIAEPDYIAYADEPPSRFTNDPQFVHQWGLKNTGQPTVPGGTFTGTAGVDINIEPAWAVTTGDHGVRVAILDDGVDWKHPELAGREQLALGYDYIDMDPDPSYAPGDRHGTPVAGILAARGDNRRGVAGVDWGSELIPFRIWELCSGGKVCGPYSAMADALVHAAISGAHVANLSGGGATSAQILVDAITVVSESVLVVASTGNDNAPKSLYPAAYPQTLAVGAVNPCGVRKSPRTCEGEGWGSNYGRDIDLVAPGTHISTTDGVAGNGYATGDYIPGFNGTSAAAPFASGVASLVLSRSPSLSPAQLKQLLRDTARDIMAPGIDVETGAGLLDAGAALAVTVGTEIPAAPDLGPHLFPNPTWGGVSIHGGAPEWSVRVLDILGRVVFEERAVSGRFDLDVVSGVYLVHMTAPGSSFWRHMVVVR